MHCEWLTLPASEVINLLCVSNSSPRWNMLDWTHQLKTCESGCEGTHMLRMCEGYESTYEWKPAMGEGLRGPLQVEGSWRNSWAEAYEGESFEDTHELRPMRMRVVVAPIGSGLVRKKSSCFASMSCELMRELEQGDTGSEGKCVCEIVRAWRWIRVWGKIN